MCAFLGHIITIIRSITTYHFKP